MRFSRREFGQTMAGAAALAELLPSHAAAQTVEPGSITDVPGLRVGHANDPRRPTGCTAILFEAASATGVDYNGSAPGESQGVMLQPTSPVERIHGLFFTGGGVLALPAAG